MYHLPLAEVEAEIAAQPIGAQLATTTVSRMFKKLIGWSPVEYRRRDGS